MSNSPTGNNYIFNPEHRATAKNVLKVLKVLDRTDEIYTVPKKEIVEDRSKRHRHHNLAACLIKNLAELIRYPYDICEKSDVPELEGFLQACEEVLDVFGMEGKVGPIKKLLDMSAGKYFKDKEYCPTLLMRDGEGMELRRLLQLTKEEALKSVFSPTNLKLAVAALKEDGLSFKSDIEDFLIPEEN